MGGAPRRRFRFGRADIPVPSAGSAATAPTALPRRRPGTPSAAPRASWPTPARGGGGGGGGGVIEQQSIVLKIDLKNKHGQNEAHYCTLGKNPSEAVYNIVKSIVIQHALFIIRQVLIVDESLILGHLSSAAEKIWLFIDKCNYHPTKNARDAPQYINLADTTNANKSLRMVATNQIKSSKHSLYITFDMPLLLATVLSKVSEEATDAFKEAEDKNRAKKKQLRQRLANKEEKLTLALSSSESFELFAQQLQKKNKELNQRVDELEDALLSEDPSSSSSSAAAAKGQDNN